MDQTLLNGAPVPQECSAEALETMLQSPVMQEFCLAVNALMNIFYHHAHLTNREDAKALLNKSHRNNGSLFDSPKTEHELLTESFSKKTWTI